MKRFIYALPVIAAFLCAALFFFDAHTPLAKLKTNALLPSGKKAPLSPSSAMLLGLDGKKEIWIGNSMSHSRCLFRFESATLFTSRGDLIQDLQNIEGDVEMLSHSGKAQICYLDAPCGRCDVGTMEMKLPKANISIFESPFKGPLDALSTVNIHTHLAAEGASKDLVFSLKEGLSLKTSRIQANLFSDP